MARGCRRKSEAGPKRPWRGREERRDGHGERSTKRNRQEVSPKAKARRPLPAPASRLRRGPAPGRAQAEADAAAATASQTAPDCVAAVVPPHPPGLPRRPARPARRPLPRPLSAPRVLSPGPGPLPEAGAPRPGSAFPGSPLQARVPGASSPGPGPTPGDPGPFPSHTACGLSPPGRPPPPSLGYGLGEARVRGDEQVRGGGRGARVQSGCWSPAARARSLPVRRDSRRTR